MFYTCRVLGSKRAIMFCTCSVLGLKRTIMFCTCRVLGLKRTIMFCTCRVLGSKRTIMFCTCRVLGVKEGNHVLYLQGVGVKENNHVPYLQSVGVEDVDHFVCCVAHSEMQQYAVTPSHPPRAQTSVTGIHVTPESMHHNISMLNFITEGRDLPDQYCALRGFNCNKVYLDRTAITTSQILIIMDTVM